MSEDARKYWNRKADEKQAQQVAAAAPEVHSGFGADSAYANTPSAPGRPSGFRSGAAPGGGGAGFYAPELSQRTAPASAPDTAEPVQGGFVGGNIGGAEAAPALAPQTGVLGSSVGGSMVRTMGPTGVEEIKSTGRPSWQLYQGAGQSDQYPAAVGAWREGLVKEAGANERAQIQAQSAEITAKAHVEGSTAAAKNPYYDALAGKVKAETAGLEATNRKADLATGQATLRKQLEEEVGVPSADGKNLSLPVDPGFQAVHKKMDHLTMQGVSPEEAYKAVAPDLHKHYYTPENLYGAINLMEKQTGQPVPPELKKQLMSGTPEAMQALYPFTRRAAQQPRGFISRTFSPAPGVAPIQPVAPGGTVAPVQGGPNNAWATPWKTSGGPKGELSESEKIPQF